MVVKYLLRKENARIFKRKKNTTHEYSTNMSSNSSIIKATMITKLGIRQTQYNKIKYDSSLIQQTLIIKNASHTTKGEDMFVVGR